MDLKELRDNIDEIDRRIIRLLEKRFEMVEEIAKLKQSHELEIEDGTREENVLKNWMNAADKIEPKFLEKVVGLVVEYSKYIQSEANRRRRGGI
ncbi:MAG: chorismate mutase [Candidatus Hydrothermarchaeaceae archaeon]